MKFQILSIYGSKVPAGLTNVKHAHMEGQAKRNMPHQLFQCWGLKKKESVTVNKIQIAQFGLNPY